MLKCFAKIHGVIKYKMFLSSGQDLARNPFKWFYSLFSHQKWIVAECRTTITTIIIRIGAKKVNWPHTTCQEMCLVLYVDYLNQILLWEAFFLLDFYPPDPPSSMSVSNIIYTFWEAFTLLVCVYIVKSFFILIQLNLRSARWENTYFLPNMFPLGRNLH